jgi:hypothetical protein
MAPVINRRVVGQPLEDDATDRSAKQNGPPKVAVQQRPHIYAQSGNCRLIETPFDTQLGYQFGIAAARRKNVGVDCVTGSGLEQQKCSANDDQQHWQRGQKASSDQGQGTVQ